MRRDGTAVSDRDIWVFGPHDDPDRYETSEVAALAAGNTLVIRATRRDGDLLQEVAAKVDVEVDPLLDRAVDRLTSVRQIPHPSLAKIVDVFVGAPLRREGEQPVEDAVFFVVSEWVEGEPLGGCPAMTVDATVRMIRGVASGAGALHEAGLVHRDLHPGNVIVTPSGDGVIIDYGTARHADGTTTATVAGVPGFIAPGAVSGGVSAADDCWSIGMLAVYALLGRPQGRSSLNEVRAALLDAVGSGRSDRRVVDDIVKMIHPDPRRRPQDLLAWSNGLGNSISRRRPLMVAAGLVSGVVALTAIAWIGVGLEGGAESQVESLETVDGADAAVFEPEAVEETATSDVAAPEVAPAPSEVPLTSLFECAADSARAAAFGAPSGSCLAGDPEFLVDIEFRDVIDASGEVVGVVLESPGIEPIYLPLAAWLSYKEIAGRSNPANAPVFGGYPTSIEYLRSPDGVAVELDGGGVLVGPRDDTQLFWIHPGAREIWEELGGRSGVLGFPASNVRVTTDGAILEFQGGFLSATPDDVAAFQAGQDIPIEVTLIDDRTGPLGNPPPVNGLISMWNGVAWWVDPEGVRHWIRDGSVWNCLGGADALLADDLPGWAVWEYPLGPVADCDQLGG